MLISKLIKDRAIKELGEIIRLEDEDPRKQVTFIQGTKTFNIPTKNRVGGPKTQWAIDTMKQAWDSLELAIRCEEDANAKFNYKQKTHIETVYDAALSNEF